MQDNFKTPSAFDANVQQRMREEYDIMHACAGSPHIIDAYCMGRVYLAGAWRPCILMEVCFWCGGLWRSLLFVVWRDDGLVEGLCVRVCVVEAACVVCGGGCLCKDLLCAVGASVWVRASGDPAPCLINQALTCVGIPLLTTTAPCCRSSSTNPPAQPHTHPHPHTHNS